MYILRFQVYIHTINVQIHTTFKHIYVCVSMYIHIQAQNMTYTSYFTISKEKCEYV